MKILILASGRGSNARAVMEAAASGKIRAEVCALFSDVADVPALSIAREFSVPARFIDPGRPGARLSPEGEAAYIEAMREVRADLVVLAGFMRILPDSIVREFEGKMINLHPSLLPAYKGKDAIRRAFEAGEARGGCSVHFVSGELDGGKVIAQKAVDILPSDTLETFEGRVHAAEHALLVGVVSGFADGKSGSGI